MQPVPLSDGRTHVWPLDQGTDPVPPTLAEQLEQSAADELAGKRAKRGGKDAAK